MYFSHLSLNDFRSYEAVDVEFSPGINVLLGPNGQGKTNLVEALGYVATLSSHRVAADAALVRAGAPRAVVRARIVRGDRASTVELEINPGKSNRARINRGAATRPRDVLGIARTVTFAPEDLALVKGDPDGRRRFLDQLGVLLLPRYAATLSDYDRVLRQRSALLKSAGGLRFGRRGRGDSGARDSGADTVGADGPTGDGALATLDIWDGRLAGLGAQIVATRLRLIAALGPYVADAYAQVSAGQGEAVIGYRSSMEPFLDDATAQVGGSAREPTSADIAHDRAADPGAADPGADPDAADSGAADPANDPAAIEARLLAAIERARPKELDRGQSLVGPHRDEMELVLGGLPAKAYASHGESWSFALALRLASYRLLTDGHEAVPWAAQWGPDGEPILVLDDVFAELDVRRRDRLGELVADAAQVLITAAVPGDIPASLDGVHFEVENGTVRRG